jgi:hypothetical protein
MQHGTTNYDGSFCGPHLFVLLIMFSHRIYFFSLSIKVRSVFTNESRI